MTRREAYNLLRGGFPEGVYFSPTAAKEMAAVLYDAMRLLGDHLPDQPASSEELARMARSRDVVAVSAERIDELETQIQSVSDGAQRDSASLHKRVEALEKRLLPPSAENSWAMLTTPELTAAVERLETELADIRKADSGRQYDRRRMLESIQGAEKMAEVAQERARAIEMELRGVRKSIAQLQAQWNNLRARLKALLSSAS